MMKVLQITDTHLGLSKPHFNGNWEPLARRVAAIAPDLVVHTGDLSVDGADHGEDLTFAAARLRDLPAPALPLPGNHDIGHLPGTRQPVDAARLARWRGLVGPDRWCVDRGGWRLIGLDSLLLGSGLDEEAEQWAWLTGCLEARGGRPAALFSHQPLFVDDPDEGDTGYWGIPPAPRRALLGLLNRHGVALFASGHLHRAFEGRLGGAALVWAPASSFTVGPMERDMPGRRVLGAVLHHFGAGEVLSEVVDVPGLVPHRLDDVVDEVYPRAASAA